MERNKKTQIIIKLSSWGKADNGIVSFAPITWIAFARKVQTVS